MDKDVKHTKNIKWNEKLEEAVKNIGECSKGYKLMHIYEAHRTSKIHNFLMLLGIFIGPLSGVISGIGVSLSTCSNPGWSVSTTILGFISGIIVAIIKFGKYEEISMSNKQAAARYTSIENNVRRQLGLYRTDRVEATRYMEWLESKYEELFLSAPLIPKNIYKKANKEGIFVPRYYESIITINKNNVENENVIQINDKNDDDNGEKNENINIIDDTTENISIIKRSNSITKTFPDLNSLSDKRLAYELKRLIDNN